MATAMRHLEAADEDLPEAVASGLRADGAVVVRGVAVADDDALLAVVGCAGTPSDQGNGPEGTVIYDVTPRPEAERADLSSTAERFPLHTDSTFMPEPHDVIALGCQHAPADGGGESRVVAVEAVCAELDEGTLAALAEPAYPFVYEVPFVGRSIALLPVLGVDADGRRTCRYREDIIARAGETAGVELGDVHRRALEAFESVLGREELQGAFLLEPGDVLVLDNRRMLHGRTAIAGDGRRLVRRVKAYRG